MRRSEQKIFPVWGYVALNLIFAGLLVAVYFGSVHYASTNNFRSVGIFPVLFVCWLAFLFVSFCDWLYEKVSNRPTAEVTEREAATAREKSGNEDSYRNFE